MKNLFLIGLIALVTVNLIAQDETSISKNTLSVGLNWNKFEAPVKGPSITGEYAFSINKYFTLASSLSGSTSVNNINGSFTNYSFIESAFFVRLTPFANSFSRLKIDFGGFYQYMNETGGSLSDEPDAFSYYEVFFGSYAKHQHFGIKSGISLNILETKSFDLGVMAQSNRYPNWKLGTYYRGIGIYFRSKF